MKRFWCWLCIIAYIVDIAFCFVFMEARWISFGYPLDLHIAAISTALGFILVPWVALSVAKLSD